MRDFLQAHLLAALLLLGDCGDSIAGNLIPADRERFALITRAIYRRASHDSLRQQAGEFLERFAMRHVQEAQQSSRPISPVPRPACCRPSTSNPIA